LKKIASSATEREKGTDFPPTIERLSNVLHETINVCPPFGGENLI